MNRYFIGAIMAGLVLLALSRVGGENRLVADNANQPGGELRAASDSGLGTLPIDQAGRIAQRQTQPTGGVPAAGTGALGQMPANGTGTATFTAPAGTGQPIPNATISPGATGVAPRPATGNQFPATGDISPVQPDLVRPETLPANPDQDPDSIPALW